MEEAFWLSRASQPPAWSEAVLISYGPVEPSAEQEFGFYFFLLKWTYRWWYHNPKADSSRLSTGIPSSGQLFDHVAKNQ